MSNMYQDPSSAENNPYLGRSNPYLDSAVGKAQGDLTRQYNLTTQPAYNSAMVNSGSFGNAGVEQMNQNSQKNLMDAQGNVSNQMRGQDYSNQQNLYMQQQGIDSGNYWNNNNFNRNLYNDAYSQNNQNLQTGIGLLGTQAGYNTNNLNNGTTIQNTPFNYWSQFNSAANGLGHGFGSGTNTTGTTSNPFASALGGAQLGSSAMGYWNRGGGSSGSAPTDASGYGLSNYNAGGSASGVTPYL